MKILKEPREAHFGRSSSLEILHPDLEDQQRIQTETATNALRIVLLGKTGSGKSSLGNTILGKQVFESVNPRSVTNSCQKAEAKVGGRSLTVIDTPGFFDSSFSERSREILECVKCVGESAPAPHAFLLVVNVQRFSREERDAPQRIVRLFGEEATKRAVVVFSHGDELKRRNRSVEELVRRHDGLKKLVSDCGNRYHVVNNREKKDRCQVTELMRKIDDVVRANGEFRDGDGDAETKCNRKQKGVNKWNEEKSKSAQIKEELLIGKESIKRCLKVLIQRGQQFEKNK